MKIRNFRTEVKCAKTVMPVIVVFLCALLLGGCGDGWKTTDYKDVSFSVKRNWDHDDDRSCDNYFVNVSSDSSRVAFQLRVFPTNTPDSENRTMEEGVQAGRDSFNKYKADDNGKVTRDEATTVSGYSAWEHWYTYDDAFDGTQTETRNLYVEKDGSFYCFVFDGYSTYEGNFDEEYEKVKESISWK